MTERLPANTRLKAMTRVLRCASRAAPSSVMTIEAFMQHARTVDRLGRWSAWICYVGNVIALGGCMATAVCWFKGYDGSIALRYNLTCFGLWFIMISIDQFLLHRARQHLEQLRGAILRPRNPPMRRL